MTEITTAAAIATLSPGAIAGDFFQLGLVTRDLDAAMALYRDRYGVPDFFQFDTDSRRKPGAPPRANMRVALAWRGPVQIELIEPNSAEPGIYADALRDDGGIALHHLGYYADDPALWAELPDRLAARNIPVPVLRHNSGGISLLYADTRPDLGLWTEFVHLHEEGRRFLENVPRH